MNPVSDHVPALLTAKALHDTMSKGAGVRVFDVTTHLVKHGPSRSATVISGRADYLRHHIPGSGFTDMVSELSDPDGALPNTLPSTAAFAKVAGGLGITPDVHIVFYSQTGAMWATRAWWILRYFGAQRVSVLDGGLRAWTDAGYPVEHRANVYPPTAFEATPALDLVADSATVLASSVGSGRAKLLNALPVEAFDGREQGSAARPGHIPRSENLPWRNLLDPVSDRFVVNDRLRAIVQGAEEPPIAYCRGGVAASVVVFGLFLAGQEQARLYDGSLDEWSRNPDLPLRVTR